MRDDAGQRHTTVDPHTDQRIGSLPDHERDDHRLVHHPHALLDRAACSAAARLWRKIVDFIADHEAGHVRVGRDYIKKLNARLVGKPCEDINAIIRSWVTQHAEAQEAYDGASIRGLADPGRGLLIRPREVARLPRSGSATGSRPE